MSFVKKFISLGMALCISLPALRVFADNCGNMDMQQAAQPQVETAVAVWQLPWYSEYLSAHQGAYDATPVTLTAADMTAASDGVEPVEHEGETYISTTGDGYVEFTVNISTDSLYALKLTYHTDGGTGQAYTRAIYIDGTIPFREANEVSFNRVWKDDPDQLAVFDEAGNQSTPDQIEEKTLTNCYVYDSSGVNNDPLLFFFSAGVHTIRLQAVLEPMLLKQMDLLPVENAASYKDVAAGYDTTDYEEKSIRIEAENIYNKSDSTLIPGSDRSSAAMSPVTVDTVLLNYLSGDRFSTVGQWVSYWVEVEAAGYYKLAFKYRQTQNDGGFCTKQVLVDGELPFAEAANVEFLYSNQWNSMTFADEEQPYLFYLTEGEHVITLRNSIGNMSQPVDGVQVVVQELNDIYRKIYMIVGPDPDTFRDYEFTKLLAEELVLLEDCAVRLEEIIRYVKEVAGVKSGYTTTIEKLVNTIRNMLEDPETIAERMSDFKSNLSGLADWALEQQSQPVDLDYLELLPEEQQASAATAGFWTELIHGIKLFISSFTSSYSTIGTVSSSQQDTITVWLTSGGRDQATLVRELITDSFTPQTGTGVTVQLVSGSLMTATLAGIGPDVALFNASGDPINYAVRGAVLDLTEFADFDEVSQRFYPESFVSYSYAGKVYALPETYTYPMLFYRTDIFAELGLTVPETWDEVYDVISRLAAKQILFGMSADYSSYLMFLHQNGGQLYDDELEMVDFDNYEGINAFAQWTRFFTEYSLPIEYNFVNRFRTGEIAIGMADFTTYNQLQVFAPEIRGLWEMAPVPGTIREDGTVDRSVVCVGSANMIMSQTDKPQQAWEFLKWWSSDAVQAAYSRQLESVMGIAGRYASANVNAFSQQAWATNDLQKLALQREYTKGVPEVPGSYITSRYINFMFRAVVNQAEDPGEQILYYSKLINTELERKRDEFADALAAMKE